MGSENRQAERGARERAAGRRARAVDSLRGGGALLTCGPAREEAALHAAAAVPRGAVGERNAGPRRAALGRRGGAGPRKKGWARGTGTGHGPCFGLG